MGKMGSIKTLHRHLHPPRIFVERSCDIPVSGSCSAWERYSAEGCKPRPVGRQINARNGKGISTQGKRESLEVSHPKGSKSQTDGLFLKFF